MLGVYVFPLFVRVITEPYSLGLVHAVLRGSQVTG